MLSGDLFPVKNCSLLESNRGGRQTFKACA